MNTRKFTTEGVILAGIVTLAFALRFHSVWFGLPELYHADEPIVVNHAVAYASGDLNPHFFKIPPLLSYLLAGIYGIFFITAKLSGMYATAREFEHLFYRDASVFYFLGRMFFGVLAGALTISLWGRILKRHFGYMTGWLSALFLAVNFLHVRESHYLYPDIPLTLIAVIYFGALFELIDSHRLRDHIYIGILTGLAAAMKYNGIVLVISYVYILFSTPRPEGRIKSALIAGFMSIVTYALCNPCSILDFRFFIFDLKGEARAHAGGVPWLFHVYRSMAGGMGWPLFIMSLIGMLHAFLRKDKYPERDTARRAVAIFLAVYYLVLKFWGQPYARYAVIMMPFMIFFAADLTVHIFKNNPVETKRRWVLTALVLLFVCLVPLLKSMRFNQIMQSADTRTLAKKWIQTNIPPESKIALDHDFFMPQLSFSNSQLKAKRENFQRERPGQEIKLRKLDYLIGLNAPGFQLFRLDDGGSNEFLLMKPLVPRSVEGLKRLGVEYVVVNRIREGDIYSNFYADLSAHANLLIEFTPYYTGRKFPFQHPLTAGPFLLQDLRERERNGQPILIYKL